MTDEAPSSVQSHPDSMPDVLRDVYKRQPLYHQEKAHYTDVFSTVMRKMGEREPKVVAITAAMADGTGRCV